MGRMGYTRRWRVLAPVDPAVGAVWEIKATGAAVLRIVSLVARLVTSAVAANRQVTLLADDGERVWYAQAATAVQVASQTTDYAAHTNATPGGATPGVLTLPLPNAGLLLLPGHRLRVTTSAIDVADQWSSIRALTDETPSDIPFIGDDGVMPVTGALE